MGEKVPFQWRNLADTKNEQSYHHSIWNNGCGTLRIPNYFCSIPTKKKNNLTPTISQLLKKKKRIGLDVSKMPKSLMRIKR